MNKSQLENFGATISLSSWTMFQNGGRYMYAYCQDWRITTDKVMGQELQDESFRSSEKWSLVATSKDGDIVAVIPGCQVKGIAFSDTPPPQAGDAMTFNLTAQENC